MKKWWNSLSDTQKRLLTLGVPVVAALAVITLMRSRNEPAAAASPATRRAVAPSGPIGGGMTGAVGQDEIATLRTLISDQSASFEDALAQTAEQQMDRIGGLREEFAGQLEGIDDDAATLAGDAFDRNRQIAADAFARIGVPVGGFGGTTASGETPAQRLDRIGRELTVGTRTAEQLEAELARQRAYAREHGSLEGYSD